MNNNGNEKRLRVRQTGMKTADTAGAGATTDDFNLQFLIHIPHYFLKVKGHITLIEKNTVIPALILSLSSCSYRINLH